MGHSREKVCGGFAGKLLAIWHVNRNENLCERILYVASVRKRNSGFECNETKHGSSLDILDCFKWYIFYFDDPYPQETEFLSR